MKSDFARQESEFLGHVVTNNGIWLNLRKVKAIQEWKRPLTQKWLRSIFFGLANYYGRFNEDYLKVVRTLPDL